MAVDSTASDGDGDPRGILTIVIRGARKLDTSPAGAGLSCYCVLDYDQQQVY